MRRSSAAIHTFRACAPASPTGQGQGRGVQGEAGGREGRDGGRDGGGEGLTHYRAFASTYRRPAGHGFFVAKLKLTGLWLIDRYGGAATISPTDYFSAAGTVAALPVVSKPAPAALSAVSAAAAAVSAAVVAVAAAVAAPAPVPRGETAQAPPWFSDKAATARWMVQNLQVHLTLTPTLTPTLPLPLPLTRSWRAMVCGSSLRARSASSYP